MLSFVLFYLIFEARLAVDRSKYLNASGKRLGFVPKWLLYRSLPIELSVAFSMRFVPTPIAYVEGLQADSCSLQADTPRSSLWPILSVEGWGPRWSLLA